MNGRGAQWKGKRGECELAAVLSALFACDCRRGAPPFLPGFVAPDVIGALGLHIEVKRRGLFSLPAAVRQSQADARPDETPVVMHRANGERRLVTCELSDLPRLAAAVASLTARHPAQKTLVNLTCLC
jgi:hypothetical protein